MKWTRRKLYGLNALAVLCLLFPAPDSRASEGVLRADSHEIIEQNTDRVTGRIMAADGEPLAGASVMIYNRKNEMCRVGKRNAMVLLENEM